MSNKNQDYIKKVFSSKFKNFEAIPPADSWNSIASALVQNETANVASNKSLNNKFYYRKILALVAMLLLLSLGIYQIYNNQNKNNLEGLRISENMMLKLPKLSNEDFQQNLLASRSNEATKNDLQQKNYKSSYKQVKSIKSSSQKVEPTADDLSTSKKPTIDTNKITDGGVDTSKRPEAEDKKDAKKLKDTPAALLPQKKESKSNGVMINSNAMLLAQKNESQGGVNTIMSAKELETKESSEKVLLDFMQRENKDYVLEHSIPISFELLFSKEIYPNLYLESGLSLTHLSTTITSNSILNFREKVRFLYLGVPLNVRYNILSVGNGNLFLQAGMVFQKDIYGEYKRQIDLRELNDMYEYSSLAFMSMKDYSTERVHQKHWQLSSRVNVGFSYPLYKSLQLQAAVGGAYSFDAHNLYPTIYSDKKLQLDFNLGLKFNFK